MKWIIKQADILDEPADVLVCSANVYLNLSGGVGGEILRRYGNEMQERLHRFLADKHVKFVQRGEVVAMPPCGTHFNTVLHAVAIDAFYSSSPEVIQAVVTKALDAAASLDAKRVALTALATGYGRLSKEKFAEGVRPLLARDFPPIEEIVICLRRQEQAEVLSRSLPGVKMA